MRSLFCGAGDAEIIGHDRGRTSKDRSFGTSMRSSAWRRVARPRRRAALDDCGDVVATHHQAHVGNVTLVKRVSCIPRKKFSPPVIARILGSYTTSKSGVTVEDFDDVLGNA